MSDPRFIKHDLKSCLAHTAEECGELVAALGKTLRWGVFSVNPIVPADQQEPNHLWIRREIKDLREALERLEEVLPAADDSYPDFREQHIAYIPAEDTWKPVREPGEYYLSINLAAVRKLAPSAITVRSEDRGPDPANRTPA